MTKTTEDVLTYLIKEYQRKSCVFQHAPDDLKAMRQQELRDLDDCIECMKSVVRRKRRVIHFPNSV